jgi:hypothetical protein
MIRRAMLVVRCHSMIAVDEGVHLIFCVNIPCPYLIGNLLVMQAYIKWMRKPK